MDLNESLASASRIAKPFVDHFYSLLDTRRDELATIFTERSTFQFGNTIRGGRGMILDYLMSLPSTNHFVTSADGHPMENGGFMILVLGQMRTDNDAYPKPFSQSFFIKMNPCGQYIVMNTSFRYHEDNFE